MIVFFSQVHSLFWHAAERHIVSFSLELNPRPVNVLQQSFVTFNPLAYIMQLDLYTPVQRNTSPQTLTSELRS